MKFLPLDELIVLELGQAVAGPYIGTLLPISVQRLFHIETEDQRSRQKLDNLSVET